MSRKVLVWLAAAAVSASLALASAYEKRTVIRFNEPVIVAGVPVITLDPGTYVVRLMNHDHNRNIVQFFNEREDYLYTTVLAIPRYKLDPPEKSEFGFWETPKGNPIALHTWFSTGDRWGQEFVYPKGLAAKIAEETGRPVLTAEAKTPEELVTAPVTEITPAGEEHPVEIAEIEAPLPPEPEVAAVEPAPEPVLEPAFEPAPEPPAVPAEVPATASPYFTFGLLGALAAGAGLMLRRLGSHLS